MIFLMLIKEWSLIIHFDFSIQILTLGLLMSDDRSFYTMDVFMSKVLEHLEF